MSNQNRKTDWTSYYRGKKSFFSTYTQRFTFDMLLSFFDDAASSFPNSAKEYSLMELGGGNSCFAASLCNERNVFAYDIVDNNNLAVELFEKQNLKANTYHGYLLDLSKPMKPDKQYDFVFSIGLIEHFTGEDQKTVIQNHFQYCRDGSTVCINFPTPTLKYRFWRKVMEQSHVWHFWDKVPLKYEDIKDELEQYGKILRTELNKKLFLTQRMLFVRKEEENEFHG